MRHRSGMRCELPDHRRDEQPQLDDDGEHLREVAHLDDQGGHPEREPDGEQQLDQDQQRHPHRRGVRDEAIEDEEQHQRDPRQDGVHRVHQNGLERKALPRELGLATSGRGW